MFIFSILNLNEYQSPQLTRQIDINRLKGRKEVYLLSERLAFMPHLAHA